MGGMPKPTVKKQKRIHAKIYSLANGEVIDIVTRVVGNGNGKTKLVKSSKTRNGESFNGEFITIGNSRITNTRVNISDLRGKTVRGNEYSQSSSNQQPGTAILIGNKGTVINIDYTSNASTKNAIGTGKDNKGVRYKFTCCEIKYVAQ